MSSDADVIETLIERVSRAPEDRDFVKLLRIAELDPSRDLRFFDWTEVDMSGCDLRGFDFTGSNLTACKFDHALISEACFDKAEMSREQLMATKDWDNYLKNWRKPAVPIRDRHLLDLSMFSDSPVAPELVVIPSGKFLMGSEQSNRQAYKDERPQHQVSIDYRFAIGRFPVTFSEYDMFCEKTARRKPSNDGLRRDRKPVVNVTWDDAMLYIDWLTSMTGTVYRLPSEAEWEYACRAGTTSAYSFGKKISKNHVNYERSVLADGNYIDVGSYLQMRGDFTICTEPSLSGWLTIGLMIIKTRQLMDLRTATQPQGRTLPR